MANNISNYAQAALLNWLFLGATPTRPSQLYLALYTAEETGADGGTEVSGNGYARQAITFGGATGGSPSVVSNTNALTFTAAGGGFGTVVAMSVRDALTGGDELWYGPLGEASLPFTAATNGNFTSPDHGYSAGDEVVISAGSSLPGGVTAENAYFVITPTTDTYQLSATLGGSAIAISSSGAGSTSRVHFKTIGNGDSLTVAVGAVTCSLD